MTSLMLRAAIAGSLATLLMDLLSGAAMWMRATAPLPPNLVGRWFASVARMHVLHADIAKTAPINHELVIALPVHYSIGVGLTSLYLVGLHQLHWPPRSFALALAFGLMTNLLPWLVMFPSMGYGFFGVNGPAGTRLFISSFVSHAFFGVGLWIGIRAAGLS